MEGDLIWHPMTKKLWQITFVEHERNFYPLGKLLTFQLKCGLFDYSSERIDTPLGTDQGPNQVANTFSTDLIDSHYALTVTIDGEEHSLTTADGEVILTGEITVDEIIAFANNELIQTEATEDMIWDEMNPINIDQRKY